MVYSARRFVVCLTLCHFVLVFFSPFSIVITSLGEESANLSAFHTFDRFVLVWICRFPFPLDVWDGLRFVILALPGLFSYLLFICYCFVWGWKCFSEGDVIIYAIFTLALRNCVTSLYNCTSIYRMDIQLYIKTNKQSI